MDKPELLVAIQRNHKEVELELIQHLAQIEINRQIDESIKGMLYKKPLDQLESVVKYRAVSTSGKDEIILGSNPNTATKKKK